MKRQRSYLRRRSPDRPKWENAEVRLAYRDEHPDDELVQFFPGCSRHAEVSHPGGYALLSRRFTEATDMHHITGGLLGTPRWDLPENLIALHRITHAFVERYTSDGLVLCLLAKKRSGGLCWETLGRITHVDVRGWVETRTLVFDWVEPYRQELLT